jgi:hypothetical protein
VPDSKKKPSVFIALFASGERDGWLCPSIAPFLVSLSQQKGREITLQIRALKPIDYARNCVVKDFLASGYEWLLMIDNDQGPPPNLLEMVDRSEPHMDVLVPKFYGIMHPMAAPAPGVGLNLCWQLFAGGDRKSEWCEIAWAGTGVMFVHRRVFEGMGNCGWFRFIYDADGMRLNSEDINFCQKARRAGFSVWGNRHFEADHFKTIQLSALVRGLKVAVLDLPPGELGLELPAPGAMASAVARSGDPAVRPDSPQKMPPPTPPR